MFKWNKYVKYRQSFEGVSVNGTSLYLSNPLMQKFVGVKYMSVLFDPKAKAICLSPSKPNEEGSYQVTKYGKSKYGGSRLGVHLADQGMEKGRYLFKEDGRDGVICVK